MPFVRDGFVQDGQPPKLVERVARRLRRRRFEADQRELAARGWYDLSARSAEDAIFIGGCGRSGTTLFREMLSRHPRIACGAETSIFGLPFNTANQCGAWAIDCAELSALADECHSIVEYAERFFRRYLLEREGKARWADKTPNNVRVLPKLLTWFPRGKFIHVLRDGRDVVCSLRHHPREKVINGRLVPVQTDNPIEKCAQRWLTDTMAGLAFRGHPRYMEVRYEALVRDPEATLRRVCAFVAENYDPVMLNSQAKGAGRDGVGAYVNNANARESISNRSIGRWRRDLSFGERRALAGVAGELLIATEYVHDHEWLTDGLEHSDLCERENVV